MHISDKFIRNVKNRIFGLPMNLYKQKLYLLKQHSESFEIWLAITKINTEGKSLNMKVGPGVVQLHTLLWSSYCQTVKQAIRKGGLLQVYFSSFTLSWLQ